MSVKPVGWFEINVEDMPRARAFYEAVLSTKLEKLESPDPEVEMWAFAGAMDPGGSGASGALVRTKEVSSGGRGTLVYFSCEDCATELGRVASNGGRITQGKLPIGQYGFAALVVDTEDNLIGLHSSQ